MYIPFVEHITEMSSEQFEKCVEQILIDMSSNLNNCQIIHDRKIKSSDGEYQIDVSVEFDAFGVHYLTLVECKLHKSSIKRELVQLLYDKIRATGAQKGILFSTANYQSGAITYAKEHGIALVHIIDGKLTYETRSHQSIAIEPPNLACFQNYIGVFLQETDSSTIQCSYDNGCVEGLGQFLLSSK